MLADFSLNYPLSALAPAQARHAAPPNVKQLVAALRAHFTSFIQECHPDVHELLQGQHLSA
eukprot:3446067-Alexandrium_andersonii.AAC.1